MTIKIYVDGDKSSSGAKDEHESVNNTNIDHAGFSLGKSIFVRKFDIDEKQEKEATQFSSSTSSNLNDEDKSADDTARNSEDEETGLPRTPPPWNKFEWESNDKLKNDKNSVSYDKKKLVIVVIMFLSLIFLAIGLSIGFATKGRDEGTESSAADSIKEYSTATTSPTEPIHILPIYARCNNDSDCLHDESRCVSSNTMCSDPPCGYCVVNEEVKSEDIEDVVLGQCEGPCHTDARKCQVSLLKESRYNMSKMFV